MLAHVTWSATVAGCLLALSGCGAAKLDVTKTLVVDVGEAKSIDLDSQPKPQTVTVEFESAASPVSVYVFKSSDAPKDDDLFTANATKAIGSKKDEKSGSLAVDVPENTPTRIVFRGAKSKTDVKAHVTNRK